MFSSLHPFTAVFLIALVSSMAIRLWLALRQIEHVTANRHAVPPVFADRIGLAAHQKAADYTVARTRLGVVDILVDAAILLALTLGGVIAWLYQAITSWELSALWRDVALLVAVMALTSVIALPLSIYRTFVIEERFGFNRMTLKLWLIDLIKQTLVGAALGIPLLVLVLWLMQRAGDLWWLWAWLAWMAFQVLVLALYPTVIAPLFNKFTPLADDGIRQRVERLLFKCGFKAKGLFVMDGSRRSSHGNAYFTGFGAAKRIVFFDTLLSRLAPEEIEAVLAHELGHFKRRHVLKRMAWMAGGTLLFLALLAWLARQPWFYSGLGVPAPADGHGNGLALLLFALVLPVFTFLARR